jgi:hypothetical protein
MKLTEKDYRKISVDSSSSLKMFSEDRKKYKKRYLDLLPVSEERNQAVIIGNLVDCLLLEPDEFENKFHMSTVVKVPTGLMLDFVNSLYKQTIEYTNEEGILVKDFTDMCKDAYTESGFKIKLEAVLNKFVGSDAEIYYRELIEVESKGLTVVTLQDVTNAEKIVYELKTNFATAEIVNLESDDRFQVFNQFKVEEVEIEGLKMKMMMDRVVCDHIEKTIQIYDLKCTFSVENFLEEYYLKRKAYIQAYIYYKGLFNCKEDVFGFDHSEYEILFPKFIVCDSINYMNPLVFTLDEQNMTDAYFGFLYKEKWYKGVKHITEDLKWAKETGIWNISRDNYLNKGIVCLKKI